MILTISRQNSNFFEVWHELIESIWKEFWAKIPVWYLLIKVLEFIGSSKKYGTESQWLFFYKAYFYWRHCFITYLLRDHFYKSLAFLNWDSQQGRDLSMAGRKKRGFNQANLILILWGKSGIIKFEFKPTGVSLCQT